MDNKKNKKTHPDKKKETGQKKNTEKKLVKKPSTDKPHVHYERQKTKPDRSKSSPVIFSTGKTMTESEFSSESLESSSVEAFDIKPKKTLRKSADSLQDVNTPSTLLQGQLTYHGKRNTHIVTIRMIESGISWTQASKPKVVFIDDIYGVLQENTKFTIYTLKKHKKRGKTRCKTRLFECSSKDEAKLWEKTIKKILNFPKRNLVVFVNPHVAQKKAVKRFAKVKHMFERAGLEMTVYETEYSGHCREICKELDVAKVDGIVAVSDDPLVNEIVNGLMDRENWEKSISIPIGLIPAGNSSGLAAGLKVTDTRRAALTIIKGFYRPLDVLEIRQGSNENSFFSVISVTWGWASDVDVENHPDSWLSLRYKPGNLKRIAFRRRYTGILSFLPSDADEESERTVCCAYYECNACNSKNCKLQLKKKKLKASTELSPEPEDKKTKKKKNKIATPTRYGPLSNFPEVDAENPPENWETVEDKFITVVAANLTHLTAEWLSSPHAHFSDGQIDLIILRNSVSKKKLMTLLGHTADGVYVEDPEVDYRKVSAFTLKPTGNKVGVISADGEDLDYSPTKVECFRGLANIIVPE